VTLNKLMNEKPRSKLPKEGENNTNASTQKSPANKPCTSNMKKRKYKTDKSESHAAAASVVQVKIFNYPLANLKMCEAYEAKS